MYTHTHTHISQTISQVKGLDIQGEATTAAAGLFNSKRSLQTTFPGILTQKLPGKTALSGKYQAREE